MCGVCVARACGYVLTGHTGPQGVGDVNLAELMNDETGLLWRHHETADGGAGEVLPF